MATLAVSRDFFADYSKLEKSVQRAVDEVFGKFAEHTHAGLHLEKLTGAKDPRIRTIRITRFWRGVVLTPERGDVYCLLRVLPHDEANDYACSRRFSVNQAVGVLEVRNEAGMESFSAALESAAASPQRGLLDHVSDADLRRLGIDEQVLALARLIRNEAQLDALGALIPEPQYLVLTGLASGMTPEEVWQELAGTFLAENTKPEKIDPDDLVTAMERSQGRIALVDGPEELLAFFDRPIALWRVFLHPRQEKVAYRPSYSGPAKVTGGAGTGKTVVALHRAKHLAERLAREGRPGLVLLTTFTRNLAATLEELIGLLVDDPAVRERIEVLNVDRVAHRLYVEATGEQPRILSAQAEDELWTRVVEETEAPFTPRFLAQEWRQVILAHDARTAEEYLAASRAGRGRPLGPVQRARVWQAVSAFTELLHGQSTHLQVCAEAARAWAQRADKPYAHVVVDEAQDLHPAQWRLLRAVVPTGPDDLFITGDPHQRIYDNRVSLARLGISTAGRSHRLTVSYRTTQEILDWAVRILTGERVDDLDDGVDTLDGYHSPVHGRRPEVVAAPDLDGQLKAVVNRVGRWLADGVEPEAVGVATRAGWTADRVITALEQAGHAAVRIGSAADTPDREAVRVGTMHRMKGLEFRCVAVVDVSDGTVPAPKAVTPAEEDQVQHAQDLQRERCLLFVACTRARESLLVTHGDRPSPLLP
ncbi:UvrD-helicase domain-containing protein [Carbonactinospora thermoautotrophica]|uniref:UvrD-helicase domain-containing protein n=1 Tax=Carbonactinospora thermoautotrophica TaxID=1469144 RepID=UPI00082D1001|nr:UvrD-helicase domain-containing protein [Carbonactinospora thermoautotrophica]